MALKLFGFLFSEFSEWHKKSAFSLAESWLSNEEDRFVCGFILSSLRARILINIWNIKQ